ncbi:MAG: MFS transporter [Firmicutes bacterium]|nr:MFS transporter [Bacillota bacterium]
MFFRNHRRWRLMAAILSLSLLTVMAGAAVAPALGVISAYFSDEPEILVKLIISMPALCIAVTNLFFGRLCRYFRVRTLSLAGLAMYVVFGCAAGVCSNIYVVLACRALLGVGVGIIMPM